MQIFDELSKQIFATEAELLETKQAIEVKELEISQSKDEKTELIKRKLNLEIDVDDAKTKSVVDMQEMVVLVIQFLASNRRRAYKFRNANLTQGTRIGFTK